MRTVDQQLVQQLIQQIEQLTQDGSARDRQIDDLRRQNGDLRQQITHLQMALRDEQLLKEDAVGEERREKEDLRQRLQREREDKCSVQKDLDEARQQIEQMSVDQENLMRLLNEEQLEKANIVELLSDADAAIERYKQERENQVFNIPSCDIQLTGTELGRGSYGGEMHILLGQTHRIYTTQLAISLRPACAGLTINAGTGQHTAQHGLNCIYLTFSHRADLHVFSCVGLLV